MNREQINTILFIRSVPNPLTSHNNACFLANERFLRQNLSTFPQRNEAKTQPSAERSATTNTPSFEKQLRLSGSPLWRLPEFPKKTVGASAYGLSTAHPAPERASSVGGEATQTKNDPNRFCIIQKGKVVRRRVEGADTLERPHGTVCQKSVH
jgi:hypothetical protein